jgi:multicomponent Na+:H+ antiporter subunit E
MITWLVPVLWLLVVWLALWEQVTVPTVLGGVLVALGLLAVFRPGGGIERWRLRPLAALRFVGYFIVQFVQANLHVAAAVLQPSRIRGRQAIVEVPITVTNPALVAILASAVSLTPGTSVVEIRTDRPSLVLHVLEFHDRAHADRGVHELEWRLARAFGHRAEADAIAATTGEVP